MFTILWWIRQSQSAPVNSWISNWALSHWRKWETARNKERNLDLSANRTHARASDYIDYCYIDWATRQEGNRPCLITIVICGKENASEWHFEYTLNVNSYICFCFAHPLPTRPFPNPLLPWIEYLPPPIEMVANRDEHPIHFDGDLQIKLSGRRIFLCWLSIYFLSRMKE